MKAKFVNESIVDDWELKQEDFTTYIIKKNERKIIGQFASCIYNGIELNVARKAQIIWDIVNKDPEFKRNEKFGRERSEFFFDRMMNADINKLVKSAERQVDYEIDSQIDQMKDEYESPIS